MTTTDAVSEQEWTKVGKSQPVKAQTNINRQTIDAW